MLYYDRIDISEDVNKTSATKKCDICRYCHVSDKSFKFQPNACNRYHHVLMMSINLSDIAILNIHSADYHCIIRVIICCILRQNIDLPKI